MDLHEVKMQLLAARAELEERLRNTQKHIHHKDAPISPKFNEQAVELRNEEVVHLLDLEGRKELEQIDLALQRLQEGRYLICSRCGRPIDERRLAAIPSTDVCIDCAP